MKAHIVFCGMMVLCAAGAARAACPETEAPQVIVRAVAAPARIDVSKSRAELIGKGGENIRTAEVKAAGAVTVPNWNVRSDVKMHYADSAKAGEVCIGYSEVTVEVALQPVIFIARERSAQGNCRKAITDHEQKHVRAFARSAEEWAQALRGPVTAHAHGAGMKGPMPEKYRVVFEKQLRGDIRAIVEQYTDTMMTQSVSAQAQMDSPVAFTAIRAACGAAR